MEKAKKRLYNKTIPSFLKKYGKKWNAKVYDDVLTFDDKNDNYIGKEMPVTIIEITPEMKKSVQGTPQPLFSYFGGTVLGAEVVSDSMENNIISERQINSNKQVSSNICFHKK